MKVCVQWSNLCLQEFREALKDVVKYLRQKGKMPVGEKKEESILSLRKALRISNVANVKDGLACSYASKCGGRSSCTYS